MIALYSIVEENGNLGSIMIRIAAQTIECGVFIQQYTSNTGGWPILSLVDSEAPVFDNHLSMIN